MGRRDGGPGRVPRTVEECWERCGQGDRSAIGEPEFFDHVPGCEVDIDEQAAGGPQWPDIFGRWVELEGDFQAILNVDLETAFDVRSWRWFSTKVRYLLLRPDSLLSKALRGGNPT